MCQGLVFVYSCRHRQAGEIRLCRTAREASSSSGCMATLAFMCFGSEPKNRCGEVKTSRRYMLDTCLACRVNADIHGDVMLPHEAAPAVSPPPESGAFASDPSGLVKRPYVGEVMSTSAMAAATVAVAVAMPRPAVIASGKAGLPRRGRSRSSSAGPSSSRSRPVSRGRSMSSDSGSGSGSSSGRSASRSRSTSRDRAAAANSANRLPNSRTGRRSHSAARRFATAYRLSTVEEDPIPMVPMVPNIPGMPKASIRCVDGQSRVRASPLSSSSSSSSSPPSRAARRPPPGPARRVDGTSASSPPRSGKSSKSKGKGKAKETSPSSSPSSSRSASFSMARDLPLRTSGATPASASSPGFHQHREHSADSDSSSSAGKRRSPPTGFSARLRSKSKVTKSDESLVCADAARIEGKGNFI